MLQRKDIDGVVICNQDHWHIHAAIYAGRAGKDMYVEKPLSVSMQWSFELRKVIQQYGNIFQYGTQQRSSNHFRFACELVRNGYIGEIKYVEAWCPDISEQYNSFNVKEFGSTEVAPIPDGIDYDMWLGPAPLKPYTVDRCTAQGTYHCYDYALGFIAGWGSHPLDIAQWGIGKDDTSPAYYEGTGILPSKGLYDTVHSWDINCQYADGIPIRFMSDQVAKPIITKYHPRWFTHGTTFWGTEGWVSVDRGGLFASNPRLREIKLKNNDISLYKSLNHAGNFVECMKSRQQTINPFESAIRSDTISHMSDLCVRLGTAIKWDPIAEKIIGNESASRMLNRTMRAPWHL